MARILTKPGVVIISIPNELWINRIKKVLVRLRIFEWFTDRRGRYEQMAKRMDEEWHLHSFKLEEWLGMFGRFFKITRLVSIPFKCFPLRYVIRLEKQE
jgi:hypothetical protein